MSIILSHTPVPIRNPYSVLDEQEYDPSTESTTTTITTGDILSRPGAFVRAVSDDDLDRMSASSWSIVNSTYASDNEDEGEEIYTDATAHHLTPLTVSAPGDDGFTNISKTMTATSINSTSAAAQPDVWVVKITKKRKQQSHRKPKTPTVAAPSLADVLEGSESGSDYYSGEETEEDAGGDFYMSMTEHELSKSSKAVKLKNIRLASAHDMALFKVFQRAEVTARTPPKIVRGHLTRKEPPLKTEKPRVITTH
ncbi:hypothetical protein BGZ75_005895 [Mortierella antarctica]|nr:hypothetical protein BGZ75_005895 [Mortierella antarctica]